MAVGLGNEKIRVFVSSVQRELEHERDAASYAISVNPALDAYFEPVLYEDAPASSALAVKQCVQLVGTCGVYILIVGETAGSMVDGRSITHAEFQRARALFDDGRMQLLVFRKKLKGAREAGAEALLEEVRQTGVKYKEFATPKEFREELVKALMKLLAGAAAPADAGGGYQAAKQAMDRASTFETEPSGIDPAELDYSLGKRMIAAWDEVDSKSLNREDLQGRLVVRGHLRRDTANSLQPTRLGALVLAKDPTKDRALINAVISAEAYDGIRPSARPRDQRLITGPAEKVILEGLGFVSRNTRHPDRVIGARRVSLDEYPAEVIREAIVNAVAHRDYEATGSRIRLQIFSDRIVVTSPGVTPAPLTPQRLKSGSASPQSRNPLLAQSLYRLGLMENRGTGIERIRSIGEAAGLKGFDIKAVDGNLELTLFGPGDAIESLALPPEHLDKVLPASKRELLNERQLDMAGRLGRGETLTSRQCEEIYEVTRDTTSRDFRALIEAKVAQQVGKGRSTRYVLFGFGSQ